MVPVAAQPVGSVSYKSQEVSEADGIPVLIKHLPDWASRRERILFASTAAELKAAIGERPLLDRVEFLPGTEAAAAPYDAGLLLVIEYSTPQGSIAADTTVSTNVPNGVVYRRIGNYNAFVFDAVDTAAANALLDEVKYEKEVQWLGDNPFLISAERAFVLTTSDIFLSTVIIILIGIGVAIFGGAIGGYVFFYLRESRRAQFSTYTDAGGMTRLNLDGFASEPSTAGADKRLLGD